MAYGYKRTITTGNATGSTQSNFPLLVKFDPSDPNVGTTFKTAANGGHIQNTVTQSGGNAVTMPADLIFTSDSGGTTKIPWEVESYDATGGTLWVWVKISSLTTSGAVIYAFYGDVAVTTQQNTSTFAPVNVWDTNHKAVFHLPDGTTLSLVDSSGNSNGTNNGVTATTGQIDGAGSFVAASTQNFQLGTNTLLPYGATARTFEAWVNSTSFAANAAIVHYGTPSPNSMSLFGMAGSTKFGIYGYSADFEYTTSFSTSTWYHLVGTYDGTNGRLYLNGALVGSPTALTWNTTNTDQATIGNWPGGSWKFNGKLDEVRVSNIARSADWITTSYNNQNNPLTFNTIGTEALTSVSQRIYIIKQAVNRSNTY
jgi:hypothetical protein